ncbi:hypothetical protein L6164_000486 [Bauhinia variegata]|uniref:Uncharacterized protein n=1 Tax=Bauhinia variegata TaxID=167791 RepID=A0ACB9Q8R4_BAUVA|nr:hypothetical protein L6164_000486 [Bauhinia variegata]
MAQQEEGWPLGLRLLNARIGLVRNGDLSGSVSFSTMLTGSPTSSIGSSSDLDTQSTESFFRDKSITLGSLIGISSFIELSRRSTRGRAVEPSRDKRNHKLKPWLFSLCSRLTTDAVSVSDAPSLGHYLEAERRVTSSSRRNQWPNDFSPIQDSNSLFVEGKVARPVTSPSEDGGREPNRALWEHGNGVPLGFPCLCCVDNN